MAINATSADLFGTRINWGSQAVTFNVIDQIRPVQKGVGLGLSEMATSMPIHAIVFVFSMNFSWTGVHNL